MRTWLFVLFFILFATPAIAGDTTAGLIAEIVGIEQEIRDTRWTFDNRDQKKALEERVKLVRRILGTIADYEAAVVGCGPIVTRANGLNQAVQVRVPRTVTSAEVSLIERIVRIDDQLDNGDWGWSNRQEEDALEEEMKRAKETLGRIAIGLCGDDRVVTVLPR
jgi:hypothetical protein